MKRFLLYSLATASGAVGISYELLYFRRLALTFGVAEWAVALVVGVFLIGLGLGALCAGRWREPRRPLLAYAIAELGLALLGWIAPASMDALGSLAWLAILPTTILMGASFPWLVACAAGLEPSTARASARIYGFNTLGAALGVLLCGFVLLPEWGLDITGWMAAGGNALLGLAALGLSRLLPGSAQPAAQSVASTQLPSWLTWSAAGIGASSLALQVFANRVLGSLLAGTVYTFSAILFVFLVGIGLGAWLGARCVHRSQAPRIALAWLSAAALPALALSWAALGWRTGGEDLLAGVIQVGLYEPGQPIAALTPAAWLWLCVEYSALFLLLPTLLLGAFLPACAAYIGRERPARELGVLYMYNTLGALLGGLAAAHIGLEYIGLRGILACLLLAPSLIALALAVRTWKLLVPTGLICAWLLLPGATPGTARGLRTLAYRESAASGAKVEEVQDASQAQAVRILRVNGKPVASSLMIDRRLQYLLGLITTLQHDDPRSVLCIGLGTGMSARALAEGSTQLEVVELSPAVLAMQPWFSEWNGSITSRPDTSIRIDDGRAFLRKTAAQYDCISADPIDPCVAGSAYLYTREYYQLGAARLKPGGIMTQWIPLYDLALVDIASIVRTFMEVFPHASGWVTGYDLVLLGSREPLAFDLAHWEQRLREPAIGQLAADVGVNRADDLLATCFALAADLEELGRQAPAINTDAHPWIEFHAPRANFGSYPTDVYRFLAGCRRPLPFLPGTAEHRIAEIERRRRELMDAAWDFAGEIEASRAWGLARNRYIERLRSN